MSTQDKTARVFKVLSVGTRVRMIELLKRRPLCVNALARELGISPAAVSQHLRILRDADIVTGEKKGYFTSRGESNARGKIAVGFCCGLVGSFQYRMFE